MKKIAVIGSEQLARRLINYVNETAFGTVVGMLDDFKAKGTLKHGYPIIGTLNDIPTLYKKKYFDEVIVAVGYNDFNFRKMIFEKMFFQSVPVATFIHPTSYVAESATIGKGSIVLVNSTIEMNSKIGQNVFISSDCYISHDVVIGSHSFCAPSQNIAGSSQIGKCCFLGINCTIIDGTTIGENVYAAAGSVITKEIPANVMVAGIPAVVKKKMPPLK